MRPFQRKRSNLAGLVALGVLYFALNCRSALAQDAFTTTNGFNPPDENRYVGNTVPDVLLLRQSQPAIQLSELWKQKPVLLTLVFSRCAGVCSPFLHSLKAATAKVGGTGTDYQIVVGSFDPRDGPTEMADMAAALGLKNKAGWTFAALSTNDLQRLAPAMGFWYRWDDSRQQFDHPAMLAAIERGRVARLLVGGVISPVRLQETVDELQGRLVSIYPLPGKALFRCFDYRSDGRLRIHWGIVLMIVPGATATALALFIFQRRNRRA